MRSQRIADGRERTFALVFDAGGAVMETLRDFAAHEDLSAASFTAIGAFSDAVLAWFDWEQREYRQFTVRLGNAAARQLQLDAYGHLVE